ncbi:MAG: bifunctional heptose 7-phosphate kinase/heptose 1-phosphate adenyltransferase [Gemmatimonadota bacterium]
MPGTTSQPDPNGTRDLLGRASAARILVIGDPMLDRYVSGSVDRISPEAPVPVVQVTEDRTAVGGAANVAAGIVALGARCRLIGGVGDDDAGALLRDDLAALGVPGDDLVAIPGRPTTQKTRILGGRHQMLRVDREATGPLPETAEAKLIDDAVAALEDSDVLVIQDYDKGTISAGLARRLLGEAASREIPAVVDPKLRHFFDFEGAHLFKPNRRELATALGMEELPLGRGELDGVVERLGVRNLLLTLGPDGMLLLGRDVEGLERIPSRAREVYDVTGAGDTVLAVMAVGLATGADLVASARLATVAAGLEVSRPGAVRITAEELLSEITRTAWPAGPSS